MAELFSCTFGEHAVDVLYKVGDDGKRDTDMASATEFRTGYSMDFVNRYEYAKREGDGQWFWRCQEKNRWSAWSKVGGPGNSKLAQTDRKLRLPEVEPKTASRADELLAVLDSAGITAWLQIDCLPVSRYRVGSFWICLASRSARADIIRATDKALLVSVEGRQVWLPRTALATDKDGVGMPGCVISFVTIASWATKTLAELV